MTRTSIRTDVEGDLVRLSDGPHEQIGKALPRDIAWQVFEPTDLENVIGSVVESIATDARTGTYLIRYEPGVEPLDLYSLRELLGLDGILLAWRVARLAHDLCTDLRGLHAEGIPQLLVHPERVGWKKGRFVLLPTMACVLPPLSRLPANEIAGWLHYIAPEVLRTRGMARELLPCGDVFSLGSLMLALVARHWDPLDYADPLALAEYRVENQDVERPGRGPEALGELQSLFARWCAPVPADRMGLDEAIATLDSLVERLAPERHFSGLVAGGRTDQAERCLREMEQSQAAGFVVCPARTFHLLHSDLALARTPPDCRVAMTHLNVAESAEHYDADVRLRMGRAYALWAEQSGHLANSSESYARAGSLLGWPGYLLDEWLEVLRRLGDEAILHDTCVVPAPARPRALVSLRADCLVRSGDAFAAWCEIAPCFVRSAFDQQWFDKALAVARRNDPIDLMMWMRPHRETPGGMAAAVSIVWEVNGNAEYAQQHLRQARRYTP